jgi:hypothetical protein
MKRKQVTCNMKACGFGLVAMLAAVAQPAAALNMQLQLQLTKGVERVRQNDAYLSIAASSFLAIKVCWNPLRQKLGSGYDE